MVFAALLRANPSARFCCRVLRHVREHMQMNTLLFGEYPDDQLSMYIWRIAETQRGSEDLKLFLLLHIHRKGLLLMGRFRG